MFTNNGNKYDSFKIYFLTEEHAHTAAVPKSMVWIY